jgi:hypothetical protein
MLPAHIMVDRCTSISEALAQCQDDKAVSVEVFLVCIQLYYQISAFHIRKKVIRDLCTKNVVQTLTGTQRRWTLLEYCSTVASGTESTHVPLTMTTPEVCCRSSPVLLFRSSCSRAAIAEMSVVHGIRFL